VEFTVYLCCCLLDFYEKGADYTEEREREKTLLKMRRESNWNHLSKLDLIPINRSSHYVLLRERLGLGRAQNRILCPSYKVPALGERRFGETIEGQILERREKEVVPPNPHHNHLIRLNEYGAPL